VTPTATQNVSGRLPSELVDSTSFLLKRLGMLAKERGFAAYENAGFTPYQHAALLVLDEGSRETQGEIADVLGYDRGQLVGILDELEERGLIERKRDPNDRRRHLVSMTPAGRKALARLRALARKMDDDYLAPLSDDEREALHTLLLRLAEVHEPRCAPPIVT
jgi:DNA-binding MarR family transcriptional regulator